MDTTSLSARITEILGRQMPTKDLRQLLRALFPEDKPGRGAAWNLTPAQVALVESIARELRSYRNRLVNGERTP